MEAVVLNSEGILGTRELPVLAGTRTYINRCIEYSESRLEKCLAFFHNRTLTDKGAPEIDAAIQRQLKKEAALSKHFFDCETARYYEILPSIKVDRFNMLEACGCMQASKEETILYSFHDKLAYILAYLFQEQPELIEERLRKNCERLGTTYEVLSYAFCTADIELIETINLQCLVGVCDLLDLFIQDVFWFPDNCVYAIDGIILNIADKTYTPEERVATYLLTSVACIQQNLINQIIGFFRARKEPFSTSRYCMFCSKGFGNAVITASNTRVFKPISVTLSSDVTFKLEPITCEQLGGINENCRDNQEN